MGATPTIAAAKPTAPKIAIDCMGGDGGPEVTVPAARQFSASANMQLVGNREAILAADPSADSWAKVHHVAGVLDPSLSLLSLLRNQTETPLSIALGLHQQSICEGVVSAEDTRALMSLSRHVLGMLPGVDRPAIAKEMQGKHGTFWMADLGANLTLNPAQLLQIARMTSITAQHLSNNPAPKIGLLNIGTERYKGTEQIRHAETLFAKEFGHQYGGFLEASELFENHFDVVICDGFVGNTTLKAIEGTAAMAHHLLHQQLGKTSGLQRLLLGALRPTLRKVTRDLDTGRYNGAKFLGLNGVVLKSHGSANSAAFASAIERCLAEIVGDFQSVLLDRLRFKQEEYE